MKILGRSFLTIWLASWLLVSLQPCCEAVAENLPHHGGYQLVQAGHGVNSEHVSGDHSVSTHQHCGKKPLKLIDLVSPPSQQLQTGFAKPEFKPIATIQTLTGFNTPKTEREYSSYHPPPPANLFTRLYLATQRLRI